VSNIAKQIYALLTSNERVQFLYMVMSALIMTVFDLVGIGTIVAFMGVLAQPDLVFENRWLRQLYIATGADDTHQFILMCGFALLLVYILRNLFAAFTVWLQLRFVWGTLLSLSQRLLEKYIYRPYHYYLTHNTSEIHKNLVSEMAHIVNGIMMPVSRLITQAIMTGCILTLLFWNDPVLAGSITVLFGGAYAWIYIGFRQRLLKIGNRRIESNRLRFKALSELLSGVKEVRMTGCEEYFIGSFTRALRKFTQQVINGNLIMQLPKYLIESLAFGGILGITLYTFGIKQTMGEIIPVVTLYAVAAYRMLPAFQQITQDMSALRVNRRSLDIITKDLESEIDYPDALQVREIRKRPISCNDSIKLKSVSFRYPSAETDAIKQINLTIQKNTSVGLVGTTGSGKSTVADIILGLLIPHSGQVVIDQIPITDKTAPAWQIRTGYVPQQIFLTDDTVTRNIAFGVNPNDIDHEAVIDAARASHIYEFITEELPEGFDSVIGERGIRLSGGQRQRIAIARALYHKPELLVFDEATSALDGVTETTIRQSIHELAGTKTLLIIAHRLNTVKDCDVIHVLEQGKIVASGNFKELMKSCDTFRTLVQASTH
jgi:ABC-type bacteriocin/lantibiotic exporter with double-glycine peptidase domain